MPITKQSGRQDELVAAVLINFGDVAGQSGVYVPAVDLPPNAIVTGGGLGFETNFNSATSDTFSIGEQVSGAGAAGTKYSAGVAAGGAVAVVPTMKKNAKASTVGVVWTGVGAVPTAGQARLVVKYIIDNRAHSTEG